MRQRGYGYESTNCHTSAPVTFRVRLDIPRIGFGHTYHGPRGSVAIPRR